ncbi:MAG: DUF192 domain-containing protein [Acidimicrobiia bacterium]
MRRLIALVVFALAVAACSSTEDAAEFDAGTEAPSASSSTTTTSSSTTDAAEDEQTTTTAAVSLPPQLADHDLDMVVVGDRLMLLAIADSPGLRAQGLMGVTDLGDLDGMLFYWRHEANGGFWMKDTLIPLDIVWFNEDGSYAGRASMVPCTEDPCPTYSPEGDPDFRFAIEARPGALDWIDESTVIVYSD